MISNFHDKKIKPCFVCLLSCFFLLSLLLLLFFYVSHIKYKEENIVKLFDL